ncbi:hypothetical protein O9929_26250 [Vibrio lentus]|nr:hypothetical protein [Vibrio lentus]
MKALRVKSVDNQLSLGASLARRITCSPGLDYRNIGACSDAAGVDGINLYNPNNDKLNQTLILLKCITE